MQGFGEPDHRGAAWPLSPAQEHKYDALAAFDAGHLQEAQHAFDLSTWSELRSDQGTAPIAAAPDCCIYPMSICTLDVMPHLQ